MYKKSERFVWYSLKCITYIQDREISNFIGNLPFTNLFAYFRFEFQRETRSISSISPVNTPCRTRHT